VALVLRQSVKAVKEVSRDAVAIHSDAAWPAML
jgi:hypothetical protein